MNAGEPHDPRRHRHAGRWWWYAAAAAFFAVILWLRIRGIDRHFWLLGDQVRDWAIVQRGFSELPLVGPATHVGGYTIGPAFYWVLWLVRVTFGPWFENLPHAGGIGQAFIQTAADVTLLLAIRRHTGSALTALAAMVLLATAAYDLCLSSLVWNPTMGEALVKFATALVLFDAQRTAGRTIAAAACAWAAVHSYTGAIFAALGVFAALVLVPAYERRLRDALRNAALVAGVVLALQIPLAIHQLTHPGQRAMGAVTGSLGRVITGEATPQPGASWAGLANAFTFIQGAPWQHRWQAWLLLMCMGVTAARYRHDVRLLSLTAGPLVLAVAGYALYVGDFLDAYYYLSLMPAAVLTVVLALTAVPGQRLRQGIAALLLAGAAALVPARVELADRLHRLPQYGVLLDASRDLVARGHAVRRIRPLFDLPATTDPEFLFELLGGRVSPDSPWTAIVTPSGKVAYREERRAPADRR